MIQIKYLILLDSGEVFDSSDRWDQGGLPTVDEIRQAFPEVVVQRILEAKPGEVVRMTVSPEQGYGFRDESLVFLVPRSKLPSDFYPELGEVFSFGFEEEELIVSILGVTDSEVTLDANHPLAGMTVTFEVTRAAEE